MSLPTFTVPSPTGSPFHGTHCIWASLKEGFLNIVWGCIIDDLWFGGVQAHLFIARKQLQTHVPGISNHSADYSGILTLANPSIYIGVTEASITPQEHHDPKAEVGLGKIHKAMAVMLRALMRELMVFGAITGGWAVTIRSPDDVCNDGVCCSEKKCIRGSLSLDLGGKGELFELFRILTRVKLTEGILPLCYFFSLAFRRGGVGYGN